MLFFIILNAAIVYGNPVTVQIDACSPVNSECVVDFDCCSGTCMQYKCLHVPTTDLLCQSSMCNPGEECVFNEETFQSECLPKKSHGCPPGQEETVVTSCAANGCHEYRVCKLKQQPCQGIQCSTGQHCTLKLPDSSGCTNATCLPVATCAAISNATKVNNSVKCISNYGGRCNTTDTELISSATSCTGVKCSSESNPCQNMNCSSGSLCFVLRPLKDEQDCENGNGCSLRNATPICMTINPCSLFDCYRNTKPYCFVNQKCLDRMCPPVAQCTKNATEADVAMKKYNFDILTREMQSL